MNTDIVANFWKWLVLWTAIVAALSLGVGVMTVDGYAPLRTFPTWLGMALVLAAYPAGIATSGSVAARGRFTAARLGAFMFAALSASAVAFAFANWLGPIALSADPATGTSAVLSLTLGELRDSLRVLGTALPAGASAPDAWLGYNDLAYHYVRRTDGMLLPTLFAWVGLLVGYLSAPIAVSLRRLTHWSLGAFLLVSTYFAGESGYEMILVRIAGKAEWIADLALIVPGTLLIGLGLGALAHSARVQEEEIL